METGKKAIREEENSSSKPGNAFHQSALPTRPMEKPFEYRKRPLSHQELENIARTDPKRAKRIIINRKSALRAKEKKKLYTCELEQRFQKLKSQAAQASLQVNLLQMEQKSLINENSMLKDHTKLTKQMIELQESKKDVIRKEIKFYQHFVPTQMCGTVGGNMVNNLIPVWVNNSSMAATQGLTLLHPVGQLSNQTRLPRPQALRQ
ncbi:hypothetical protein ES319_D07G184500v1 [Gossypium barbadense]|uniref:BZIP domain-containing protein n=2 Tax=Gossypium TaxID=3633 RepID=A0A5J5QT10_GOSBA|nr:hypothetical protein ES319_D07G184500v1 [Gossypium barbadense]TYG62073.1 hypothetical protein ES288_D07G198500v1 [Gossypium darwinii]